MNPSNQNNLNRYRNNEILDKIIANVVPEKRGILSIFSRYKK